MPLAPGAADLLSTAPRAAHATESEATQGTINAVDLFDPVVLANLTRPTDEQRSRPQMLETPAQDGAHFLIAVPPAGDQDDQASSLLRPPRSATGPLLPPRFTLPARPGVPLHQSTPHLPPPLPVPLRDQARAPGSPTTPVEMGGSPQRAAPRDSWNHDEPPSLVRDPRPAGWPDLPNHLDALLEGGTPFKGPLPTAETVREYQRMLVSAPRAVDALIGLAATLHRLGRLEEALQAWQQVIAVAPHRTEAYVEQGNVLAALRRSDEALARYQRAIQRAPRHALAHRQAGRALLHLARYAEALAAFERASSLVPTDGSALVGQGLALEALGRHNRALWGYTHALQIDSGNVPVMLHAGHLLLRLRRPRAAQALARQVLAGQAQNQGAWVIQGDVLMAIGSYREALAAYAHAIEVAPTDRSGYQGKARALACLGQHAEADVVLKHASVLDL